MTVESFSFCIIMGVFFFFKNSKFGRFFEKYFGYQNQNLSSAVMLEFDKLLYYHNYLLMAGNGCKCFE